MRYFLRIKYLPIFIFFILFFIPFFWLNSQEMDIGGDSNRLYFYEPLEYLKNNSLYLSETITLTNRSYWPGFFFIPYIAVLFILKSVLNSSYLLISIFNGLKLSLSFFSVYLIIRLLLQYSYNEKREINLILPSILGGLLYATAPIIIGNYTKALISHDQIFLNPLAFYFILNYFIKQKFHYLLAFLVVTFLFATNFSWVAAPGVFSFYPLAILFILIYTHFILKKRIIYSHIFIAFLIFIGLNAFHLFPEANTLLSSNSYVNQRVFTNGNIENELNYFFGVLPNSKLSLNLLLFSPYKHFNELSIIPALFVFLGLCLHKNKDKTLFLTGLFFLITLYLVTAKITDTGVKLYTLFFYIPGFSMFRNFIGQWAFVYSFFYALIFGLTLYSLFKRIRNIKVLVILTTFLFFILFGTSWDFFTGGIVNMTLFQSNNVRVPIVMDPKFEETLTFIRTIKDDGAFISFPFTDSYETVIHGMNDGAYEGPSPIYLLTGRLDYNGYQQISPFGEIFFKLAREKNYNGIKKLLGILSVKYIYYNHDTKIYDKYFPGNPYNSARNVLPQTQDAYKNFIDAIAGKEIYHNGTYHIYQIDNTYSRETIYPTQNVKVYKQSDVEMYAQTEPFFDFSQKTDDVYIDDNTCLEMLPKSFCVGIAKQFTKMPIIQYEKVNPTFYQVHIKNATTPYFLVFSRSFNSRWDISLSFDSDNKNLWNPNKLTQRHVQVNGYANAWYIVPQDVNNKLDYTLTLQQSDQKLFYLSGIITILTILLLIIYYIFFLFRK